VRATSASASATSDAVTARCGPSDAIGAPTSATASGIVTLIGSVLYYDISYSGLQGPATAAHIHGPADSATPAGVLIPLATPSGTSGTLTGNGDASATLNLDCASATDASGLAPGVNVYAAVPRADTPWFLAAPAAGGVIVDLTGPGEAAELCTGCDVIGSRFGCTNASGQVIPLGGGVLALTPSASRAFSDFAPIFVAP